MSAHELIAELDKAATQGEWLADGKMIVLPDSLAPWGKDEEANVAFMVALVNAYRASCASRYFTWQRIDGTTGRCPLNLEPTQITQEDRKAAAALYLHEQGEPSSAHDMNMSASMCAGNLDHWEIVQAFARHRIASTAPDCCDAGKVWNNADPTSGQFVPCEVHGEQADV